MLSGELPTAKGDVVPVEIRKPMPVAHQRTCDASCCVLGCHSTPVNRLCRSTL